MNSMILQHIFTFELQLGKVLLYIISTSIDAAWYLPYSSSLRTEQWNVAQPCRLGKVDVSFLSWYSYCFWIEGVNSSCSEALSDGADGHCFVVCFTEQLRKLKLRYALPRVTHHVFTASFLPVDL